MELKMNTGLIVIILVAVAFAIFYISKNQGSATMDSEIVKQKINQGSGIVIDVRTTEEFAQGHLKKAKHNWDVMSGEFEQNLDSLDKRETYYLYCRSGNRSGKATNIMKQNGFENAYNIGGYQDLVDAGLESSK